MQTEQRAVRRSAAKRADLNAAGVGQWHSSTPPRAPLPAVRGSEARAERHARPFGIFQLLLLSLLVSRWRFYEYLWLYGFIPPLSQNIFKNFKVDSFDEMSLGGNMLKSDWVQNRLRWNAGAPKQQPKRDLLFKG